MRKKNEKGFALILALVLLLVMSLMGGGLIVITSGDHNSNNSSDQYQQAFYVAETGLIEAEKKIVNAYLGDWRTVESIGSSGMTDEQQAQALAGAVEGWYRNKNDRSMPTNGIEMTGDRITACYSSFKNIDRDTFRVTDHFTEQNFGDLIEPILTKLEAEGTDDPDTDDVDESTTAESSKKEVEKEEKYLKRFVYEYFMTNIGTAPYKGAGASIKATSSDIGSQGTAYKIYACGIFYGKAGPLDVNHNGEVQILIPLESIIVMPN